jgi:hypothetical protein
MKSRRTSARTFSLSRTLGLAILLVTGGAALAQVPIQGNDLEGQRSAARRAAVASARGNLEAAQARLKAAEQRVRAEARANPDSVATQKELDDAQAALDKLSEPVLAKLKNDPDYQTALNEESDAARKLSREQAKAVAEQPASTQPTSAPAATAGPDVNPAFPKEESLNVPVPTDGQMVAAVDKLQVKSHRREMEERALAADPSTAQAVARVDAATAKLKQQRAELEAKLLNDPEYRSAREALAQSRAELTRAAGANY